MFARRLLLAVLATSFAPTFATATTYYVRVDGNNSNTGTGPETSNAWATVSYAASQSLSPGDVVLIKAGTYTAGLSPSSSGTAAGHISYIGDVSATVTGWNPGEVFIKPSSERALTLSSDNYLKFQGIQFIGNTSDVVLISSSSDLEFTNCSLSHGNRGLITSNGSAVLVNCLISENSNGGVVASGGTVNLYHCTIAANGSSGAQFVGTTAEVENSIIADNAQWGLRVTGGSVTHTYNLLFGNGGGAFSGTSASTGELFVDPQFVSSDDFHLRSTSPALNAGITLSIDEDFHGNPRPYSSGVDMGYHEHGSTRSGTVLLMVTDDGGYFNEQERLRKSTFESWGYAVTGIEEVAPQSEYDAAVATAQVVYLPEDVDAGAFGHKLREATIGVVNEEVALAEEFGFASASFQPSDTPSLDIVDNSHYITSPFSTGTITFATSAADIGALTNTNAPGLQVLGNWGSSHGLAVLDEGATLVNTYAGSNEALGKRVVVGLSNDFDWSDLAEDGFIVVRRSLEWATTANTGSSLVGHWKLDETIGTTAADSSETENDGTLNNGTTPGADGPYPGAGAYAAAFDGVDDTITVPSDTAYDLAESVTVSTWVRFNQDQEDHSSQHSLVGRFSWTNKRGFQLLSDAPNSNTLRFRVFNGTTYRDATWSNASMQGDRWYHVVGTYDRETIRLYVDGQQVASQGWTEAIEPEPNKELTIGSKVAGRQHDVRLYNRALTGLEVAELHGLVAHWKLNESSGTVADDSSLAENDAALVGTQGWTAGQDGGGHKFDGSAGDNYFEAPATSSLEDIVLGSYTLMAYYRPDSVGSQQAIVTKDDGDFGIDYNPSGFFRVDHTLSDDSVIFINSSRSYPVGSFVHVAAVVDIDAGTVKIYIDGVENDSANYTPGVAGKVFNRAWRLGARHPSGLQADGVIDDVRFYNRAVSAEDIARHANLGLVAHWTLSEASGTDAADSGDNGYDGTYTGGVTLDQDEPHPGTPAPTFDGIDDEVTLPAIDASFSSGLTIAAWIRPDETLNAGQFNEVFELSNGSQVDQILLSYGGATGLQLYLTDTADGSTLRTIEDNTSFAAGQWVHCVAVVDSSGNATLYRNGQVTKSGFFTSLPTTVLRSTATIGKSSFGDRFKGSIQDVRLYNYGLSAAEVNELYGLVGRWDFDEGSGTTIAESTGNASDASFNTGTPAWVDGIRGKALEFDGTNDARTTGTIEPPERGAISMWFRSSGPPASRQRLWGIGADYEMWQDNDGLVSMDVATDGYQGGFITTSPLYDEGRWYHLVAQYDSETESYEIYIDGVLHKSGVSTRDIKQQAANYLSFGTRTGSSQRFAGALDNFRIYNRWLSLGEIAEQYGLVGWWRMEETSGSVVADSSGVGNHGTVVGTSDWSTDSREANGSIELDGTNYVQINGFPVDRFGNEFDGVSIAGWAKLTAADTDGATLLSEGDHVSLTLDSLGGAVGSRRRASDWDTVQTNREYENSGWYHFVYTHDEWTNEMKIYVDGVLQATDSFIGTTTWTGLGEHTYLGRHGNSGLTKDFTGLLDDVRIYNRAIVPAEVRTLYYGQEVFGPRIVKWIEVANP